MASLAGVPQEVLEHIAYYAATDTFLGPPDGLVPLLSVDRRTHAALSIGTNHYLWSRVFAAKFDLASPLRRLAACGRTVSPADICEELKLRCALLRAVRGRTHARATSYALSPTHRDALRAVLWMAYLMLLENDGKNERQLREYAGFDGWLKEFLFDPTGAALAAWSVGQDLWPPSDERVSLALWLFWYMLKPGECVYVCAHQRAVYCGGNRTSAAGEEACVCPACIECTVSTFHAWGLRRRRRVHLCHIHVRRRMHSEAFTTSIAVAFCVLASPVSLILDRGVGVTCF